MTIKGKAYIAGAYEHPTRHAPDKTVAQLHAEVALGALKDAGLSRDDVLDNITLYWLTNTAISSARLYWDTRHNLPAGGFFDARGVKLPVGVSAFAEEIYQAPKSWAEGAYVKLIYYSNHPKGTHFAAWEQPTLFVSDVRATFKSLRS